MNRANPHVRSASNMTQEKVRNLAGEALGEINDFVIDMATGRIAYSVLRFGGKDEGKLFAIPWQALTRDAETNEFVLDIARETLQNAPGFDEDRWPDMSDPRWCAGAQCYTPYWQKSL